MISAHTENERAVTGMPMRTCDKNCIANVDGKCAVQRCCGPITRLGGARLTDLKPCYGKCESCAWKYNGGCSEWNGWNHRDE